jgi:hypothetical protein
VVGSGAASGEVRCRDSPPLGLLRCVGCGVRMRLRRGFAGRLGGRSCRGYFLGLVLRLGCILFESGEGVS